MIDNIEVWLLGPVEIRIDGMDVRVPGAPPRVVLARLSLNPGRVVSATELIEARANAIEAGDPANVTFRVADAAEIGPRPFDVVVFFDSLHDMAIRLRCWRRLAKFSSRAASSSPSSPGRSIASRTASATPGPLDCAASTSLCTPGSLAQPGALGLGTQRGPAKRLQLLADASFHHPTLAAADTGYNLVIAATK